MGAAYFADHYLIQYSDDMHNTHVKMLFVVRCLTDLRQKMSLMNLPYQYQRHIPINKFYT